MRNVPAAAITLVSVLALSACGNEQSDSGAEAGAESAVDEAPALPRTAAPDGARVFFVAPADGATVTSPVRFEFGAANVKIVPAGVNEPASGHHHLLINAELPNPSVPIPKDARHVHFGDGSTSAELELPPGEHELTLLLGDHLHIPHEPPIVSDTIRLTVASADEGGDAEEPAMEADEE